MRVCEAAGMMAYPEHAKMRAVKSNSQVIGDFIDWLTEHELQICSSEERVRGVVRHPVTDSAEHLLAKYFDIDLEKIGAEKDAMVEELRAG